MRFSAIVFPLVALLSARPASSHALDAGGAPTVVDVQLAEWKVSLSPDEVPPGRIVFHVHNAGKVPHAFEIEGHGIERRTPEIPPGDGATLEASVRLAPAAPAKGAKAGHGDAYKSYNVYKVYCPVGKGSHRMLGMHADLRVEAPGADAPGAMEHAMTPADDGDEASPAHPRAMRVTGGGAVIQVLPGPFPFADSAQAVIAARPPDQQADLAKKAHMGPYSNQVATIAGDIDVFAEDKGGERDSVSGTAHFTTQDGARWTLVLDRVQTKDIPFNPRFGGVVMGLFYHGASGVHTPLVPTIQSSLALWGYAHLDKDGVRVADDAMVHIMLLSRTRRPGDWALDCWDCSARPIEELQLQVTPSPGAPAFDAPGGFLFVNWEKSSGQPVHP